MTKAVRPSSKMQQRLLNMNLGAGVDAAGGLIEDQDARISQDRAGDRQQLPLPLAEVMPLLRNLGLVAAGQQVDEIISVRQLVPLQ